MLKNSVLLSALLLGSTSLFGCNLYIEEGPRDYDTRGPGSERCNDEGECGWVPDYCETDEICGDGCYCTEQNTCEEGGFCDENGACQEGFVCDYRGSCVPDETVEPEITCQGEVVCDIETPICPVGSTPAISEGCYTGECMAKDECPDGAPFACSDLNTDEDACLANDECGAVYKGVNCTSPSGEECTSGSADCSCESFEFDYCE